MNGRKAIIGVALGVTLLLSAVAADAGVVSMKKINRDQHDAGYLGAGEFELTIIESFTGHPVGTVVRSFCLELFEGIGAQPVATTLDEVAHNGGPPAQRTTPVNNGSGALGDPLGFDTAWLFNRWTGAGLLTTAEFGSMVYTDTSNPKDGAVIWDELGDALQMVVYALEDEVGSGMAGKRGILWDKYFNPASVDYLNDRAARQAQAWLALATGSGTGLGRSRVLNTYGILGGYTPGGPNLPDFTDVRQSQLVAVPLPSSLALGMMLLAGLAFYGVRRTRTRNW